MPQFHNRVDAGGQRRSWNVERLIALARTLPRITVPLSSLHEFDAVYWFDDAFPPTCRAVVEHARRIQEVNLAYPIILSADGLVRTECIALPKRICSATPRLQRCSLSETRLPMGLNEIVAVCVSAPPDAGCSRNE